MRIPSLPGNTLAPFPAIVAGPHHWSFAPCAAGSFLPKALNPVRKNFDYLIKKQYKYGYSIFFNINICRNNHEDVKQPTEIAHENGIATDYHINESPMLEQDHFQHLNDNPTFIRPGDWPQVDELLDWLIEKNRSGYKMVNSVKRLNDMKDFMRGKVEP